jgi:hypothetical protein
MAFKLQQEQATGVVADYWKINTVFVDCGVTRPIVRIYMSLYLSVQARFENKSPVSGSEIVKFLDEIDSTFSYDFRACIYNNLKQDDMWKDAEDLIDECFPPIANSITISTIKNTSKIEQLDCSDSLNLPITYVVTQNPSNGILSIDPNGFVTYIPNQDYVGSDSASYKVNNGYLDSDVKTISITITLDPDEVVAPEVSDMLTEAIMNQVLEFDSGAIDPQNLDLTLSITSQSTNGAASVVGNKIRYSPNNNFIGSDEYKFKANNGYKDSVEAVVTVNVVIDPNLKAPNVADLIATTTVDTLVVIPTNVTDDQNYPITYTIVDAPDNGVATINGNGEIEYTPNTDYVGEDIITFTANNGFLDSVEAVVTVNVVIDPNLKAPNVSDLIATTTVDTLVVIPTNVTDDQNNPITYTIVDAPDNGVATINGNGEIEYTPSTDYVGEDIITFTANNGFLDSVVATVIITVE